MNRFFIKGGCPPLLFHSVVQLMNRFAGSIQTELQNEDDLLILVSFQNTSDESLTFDTTDGELVACPGDHINITYALHFVEAHRMSREMFREFVSRSRIR